MQNIITIKKGSAEWRDLFYDCNTDDWYRNGTDTLYAKGDLSALLDQNRPKLLVTGTRLVEPEDIKTTKRIVRALADNPYKPVIISGLAVGSDTIIHSEALAAGVPTVAVLPCGPEAPVYPLRNTDLANEISATPGCALLTQFPGAEYPSAVNCLLRNHTMAMISDFGIVTACRKKGSAIVCARLLHERDRRVFAVPGAILDITHKGCNKLIYDKIADILCDYDDLKDICAMRKSNSYVNPYQ